MTGKAQQNFGPSFVVPVSDVTLGLLLIVAFTHD